MGKFKIGDKVKVLNFFKERYSDYNNEIKLVGVVSDMKNFVNRGCTITYVFNENNWYKIDIDGGRFSWTECMLGKINCKYLQ